MVLSAPLAAAVFPSFIFTNLRGTLHLVQDVPCGAVVDATTPIADGRMEITPLAQNRDAAGGAVEFDLTKLEVFFTPFQISHECLGVQATADFREIGVRLIGAVRFTGEAIGGVEDRRYRFTIPKRQVFLFESVVDNLPVQQPETMYQHASEDLTGEIDLRRRTATLHVALASKLRFRAGCVAGHCVIDETLNGRQTTDVTGALANPATDTDGDGVTGLNDNCPLVPNARQETIATPVLTVPQDAWLTSCQASNIGKAEARDVCHARPVLVTNNAPASFPIGQTIVTWSATDGIDPMVSGQQAVTMIADRAPVVSCTSIAPQRFRAFATDDCSQPTLKLGSFPLANGDVIQIEQTGQPGVRYLGTVGDGKIKHFQVGRGEALILATDAAGNVGRGACIRPLDITTDSTKKK
jgi:hypothetical protein